MATDLPIATTSVSLGKPEGGHHIETILETAAKHRIKGIEICYEHLEDLSIRNHSSSAEPSIIEAAAQVYERCEKLGLHIIVLQPFAFYEGWLDRTKHKQAIERMRHWIKVAQALHTNIIQIPSNFASSWTTGDMDVIVADLIELADLCAPIKLAYEAVAWGTHVDLWEQSCEVMKRVNRHNFGLCLDTFHIAGRVYGDPTASNGKCINAEQELEASLVRMRAELDPKKIFYVQLSDAERLAKSLRPGHSLYQEGDAPRMTWSRAARLFPSELELGGYLPVMDVVRTIVNDVGYRGWISMEVFHLRLREAGKAAIPDEFARRALESYKRVYDDLGWNELR